MRASQQRGVRYPSVRVRAVFPAAESLPALIYPDPLSPDHYVVNSGLTAAWADWAGDFPTPRYGDFAIFKVQPDSDDPDAAYAGLFDESWKLQWLAKPWSKPDVDCKPLQP